MTAKRRATRIDVIEARSDRNIVRPFFSRLATWHARQAKLGALLAHRCRNRSDVGDLIAQLRELRDQVAEGLHDFDRAICGRPITNTILTTRKVFVRLIELVNLTLADR